MSTMTTTDPTAPELARCEARLILAGYAITPRSTVQDFAQAVQTVQRELAHPGSVQEQLAELRADMALLRRILGMAASAPASLPAPRGSKLKYFRARSATTAAAALFALLSACGVPGGLDTGPAPTARPGAAPGCASRTGYVLSATAAACPTPRSATAADLSTACSPGWEPCASPPAGCSDLPAYYLGALAWRPAGGPDASGTCGQGPEGSVQVGLGCGHGAQREVAPRCGGWTRASDLPWGRGVLCCAVAP